jgi:hypothetical protein
MSYWHNPLVLTRPPYKPLVLALILFYILFYIFLLIYQKFGNTSALYVSTGIITSYYDTTTVATQPHTID